MTDTSFDGAELFARIARELAAQAHLPQTTQRLVELVVKLTGCTMAALWSLTSGGHVRLQAASDPEAGRALNRIMRDIDEGPAHTVLMNHHVVRIEDTESESRWPRYLAAVAESGLVVSSALGYSLSVADRQLGALLLYSATPAFFTEEIVQISSVLADHAAVALAAATSAEKAENLELALQSNRRIGMAIGILMAVHQLDEHQAFDLLRVASQHTHLKLREVAEHVIMTGATPGWRVRRPD